jgi:hypothetical protein
MVHASYMVADKFMEDRIFFLLGSSANIYLSKSLGLLSLELFPIINKKCSCGKPLF